MKNFVYGILLAFILLSFTCMPFVPDGYNSGEIIFTDVDYSPDGNSVTIYLGGQSPVPSSRSLTRNLAIMGHDFFEVTFMYRTAAADHIIARAEWGVGQSAGISGVYRTTSGINYGSVSGSPAVGQGSAVLFTGRKSDKTLLAVGGISHVDNVPVTPGTVMITSETKSVSFELNALKAGAKNVSDTAAGSSFLTNSKNHSGFVNEANTEVKGVAIAYRTFPLFRLDINETTQAEYTIGLHASGPGIPALGDYGIILAGGSSVFRLEPKYTLNTKVYKSSVFPNDTNTSVSLLNNIGADVPFQNPVQTAFNTTGTVDGSIFAFAFSIPVFALSSGGGGGIKWVIRPGYDDYLEELDDGNGGNGGAVLIGTGNVDLFNTHKLEIYRLPSKIQYNSVTGYQFDIAGLLVNLVTGDGVFVKAITNNATTNANYDPKLTFHYFDSSSNIVNIVPGDFFPPMNRYLKIYTEYDDTSYTGGIYSDDGEIVLNISTQSTNFQDVPPENRFTVAPGFDQWTLFGAMSNGGVFLCVFNESMDIGPVNANPSAPLTIIFMAGKPGLTLGRGGNITIYGNQNVMFYFGTWPFNEPIFSGGQPLENYPYSLNMGGSYTAFPAPSVLPANDYWIDANQGAVIDHFIGPEITPANEAWLRAP